MKAWLLYAAAACTAVALFTWTMILIDVGRPASADVSARPPSPGAVVRDAQVATTEPSETVQMPALVGIDSAKALAQLGSLGILRHVERIVVNEAILLDRVVKQSPVPGTPVEVGSYVGIVVGEHPLPTVVDRVEPYPDGEWIDVVEMDIIGDCGQVEADPPGLTVVQVDCGEPHDVQLAAIVVLDADGIFDGAAVTVDQDYKCALIEVAFVGAGLKSVTTYHVSPGEQDWAAGDRTGYCFISLKRRDQQLVGSAEGSLW